MSWQINGQGRYYHDYSEYQSALRAYEENSASRILERRAEEIARRLQGVREEFNNAAGQIEREQNLQRQFADEVRDLERTTERMDRAHREELARMDRDMEHLAATLDHTQNDIADVRRQFDEDRRKFAEKHQTLQTNIQQELENLANERSATDQRLEAAHRTASEQFEKQRRERLEREQDQAKRAALALDMAAQSLTAARELATQIGHAELTRRADGIERQIKSASDLCQRDATAALAAATGAHLEVRLLDEQTAEARGRMMADSARIQRLAGRTRELLADPRVAECFPRRKDIVAKDVEAALGRMAGVFSSYERYAAEYPIHLATLEKAEKAAEDLNADAPIAKQRCEERKIKAREAVKQIQERFGAAKLTSRSLDPGDPLAPVEVMIKLDNETLRLTFHVDREMELCAYQHATDYDCKKSMERALDMMRGIMDFKRPVQDHLALGQAPPPQAATPEPPRTIADVAKQRRVN